MPTLTQQRVNMFWHGPVLGDIHTACIRSFLRNGHPVTLHCYTPPADVPEGVTLFDARELMPRADLIAHARTGSIALGADRYRYRMQRAGLGLYADCDMFCIRPIPDRDYIFGFEQDNRVNGAILKYPPDSALAERLVACTASEFMIPPTLKPYRRQLLRLRRLVGRPVSVRELRWGLWGPELLNHAITELGLSDHAAPRARFYPLHFSKAHLLCKPGYRIKDICTAETLALHLWHKELGDTPIPEGSPLHQIMSAR